MGLEFKEFHCFVLYTDSQPVVYIDDSGVLHYWLDNVA